MTGSDRLWCGRWEDKQINRFYLPHASRSGPKGLYTDLQCVAQTTKCQNTPASCSVNDPTSVIGRKTANERSGDRARAIPDMGICIGKGATCQGARHRAHPARHPLTTPPPSASANHRARVPIRRKNPEEAQKPPQVRSKNRARGKPSNSKKAQLRAHCARSAQCSAPDPRRRNARAM